jgi:hypothetical protein
MGVNLKSHVSFAATKTTTLLSWSRKEGRTATTGQTFDAGTRAKKSRQACELRMSENNNKEARRNEFNKIQLPINNR